MSNADSISRSGLLAILSSKELTQAQIIALVKNMQPREVDNTFTGEYIWPMALG
jgi:hypothetical protein